MQKRSPGMGTLPPARTRDRHGWPRVQGGRLFLRGIRGLLTRPWSSQAESRWEKGLPAGQTAGSAASLSPRRCRERRTYP